MANAFDEFDVEKNAFDEFDVEKNAFDEFDTAQPAQKNAFDEFDEPEKDKAGAMEIGTGFIADIAISEAGRFGGAALGTAILPGIGTAAGYLIGGLGSGAAGSIARQRILDPEGEVSWGQVLADSFINLIPGAKGGKSVASAVARQAGIGAGISAGGQVVEKQVDEGRLPTMEELGTAGITGAALGAGLGISGEAFSKAYQKFAGLPSRNLTEAFKIGDKDAKLLVDGVRISGEEYGKMLPKNFKDLRTAISEAYSDELVRARVLQDIVAGGQMKPGGLLKVTDDANDFYLQRRLAEGKISEKNNELSQIIDLDRKYLLQKGKELEVEPAALSDQVNQYLYAKHGIAYNKALKKDGAAGKTNKEFKRIIKDFEGQGLNKQLSESIATRQDLSKRILDTMVDGGLVSKKVAKDLRKKFPDYVPLNRIMDEDDSASIGNKIFQSTSGRYEIGSSGLRKAKGSERDVREISQNIVDNLVMVTRRAEVNKANQAFLRLIRANKDVADTVATEVIKKGKKGGGDPKKLANRNEVMTIFENGERKFLKLKDVRLAAALKGTNKEQVSGILRGLQAYNRFLGGLYTRWNPEFAVPNLVRDRSEAFVNNMAKMSYGQAFKTLNPVQDLSAVTRILLGRKGTTPAAQKMDAQWAEFTKAGGKTGGLGQSTLQDIEKRIGDLSNSLNKPSKIRAKKFLGVMDGINEVLETSTRFATFRRARDGGMSVDQAAFAARNSSFDPQLQGAQGDALRALYLFSNPAIQGAKNFLRSLKNPKVAIPFSTALVGTVAALDTYNRSIDPDYREKIPDWKLNKHLTFVLGQNPDGTLKYASIPIGYSMVPFKVMADQAQRMLRPEDREKMDIKKEGYTLGKNILDSYNPMGGSPVPTVLRPFTDLISNKDGLGRDIRPAWLENENISELEKIHPWTARTRGGELAMNLSEQLLDIGLEVSPENLLFLYQNYTGGPGKTVERVFNVASKLWNGDSLEPAEIPIARRFYGETYAQAFENRTQRTQDLKEIEKQEGTTAAKSSRIARNYKKAFTDAENPEERKAVLRSMLEDENTDESVVRKMAQFLKEEAAGFNQEDRRLKATSTAVRAKYLAKRIKEMERDQAALYLQEQQRKGILTEKVASLIKDMESFQSTFSR